MTLDARIGYVNIDSMAGPKHRDIVAAQAALIDTLPNVGDPLHDCWSCGDGDDDYRTRCHIKARRHGGSMDPSNFFLLCDYCHEEQPDALDAASQIAWLQAREDAWTRRIRLHGTKIQALIQWIEGNSVDLNAVTAYLKSKAFHDSMGKQILTPHSACDSIILAARRYAELLIEPCALFA